MSEFLLVCGVVIFSVALRTFAHPALRKTGAVGILAATFLAVYFLTGSPAWGLVAVLGWFLLPWLEILTRIRHLRLPRHRQLRSKMPPSRELFPNLPELTDEVEGLGFEHVEDLGWEWDGQRQFYRMFHRDEDKTQAAICLAEQEDFAFYYVSLSSRSGDGEVWTTWNYPFSYGLKLGPHWKINRAHQDQSIRDLCHVHKNYLRQHGVTTDHLALADPDGLTEQLESDLSRQIHHNLKAGVLKPVGDESVRYSWRGLLFIWFQFIKDLIRLS